MKEFHCLGRAFFKANILVSSLLYYVQGKVQGEREERGEKVVGEGEGEGRDRRERLVF